MVILWLVDSLKNDGVQYILVVLYKKMDDN